MIVLDNFETPWEPHASRDKIEQFLEALADISHLAIMVRNKRRCFEIIFKHAYTVLHSRTIKMPVYYCREYQLINFITT